MTEWDRILRENRYSAEEPEEVVIEFVNFLRNIHKHLRILDLGCGAGRHEVYAAKQGFEAHGLDASQTGLEKSAMRLRDKKLGGHLVKADMTMLPYVDSCFDAVMCLNAVYHQKLVGVQKSISEMRRVLRTEGYLLVNFLSKRTYSYEKGPKVEEDTFTEQEGPERGVLHHFVDGEGVKNLLTGFNVVKMKLKENEVEGKLRSRWIVVAMV